MLMNSREPGCGGPALCMSNLCYTGSMKAGLIASIVLNILLALLLCWSIAGQVAVGFEHGFTAEGDAQRQLAGQLLCEQEALHQYPDRVGAIFKDVTVPSVQPLSFEFVGTIIDHDGQAIDFTCAIIYDAPNDIEPSIRLTTNP